MNEALGLLEVKGLSSAIVAADTAVKASNVVISSIENTKGGGLHTVKIRGEVSSVSAALDASLSVAKENKSFYSMVLIARPSDDTEILAKK